MDIKWAVDQAMQMVNDGGCPIIAAKTILNAISLSEQDTIDLYEYCDQALLKLFGGDSRKYQVLHEMIENINEDERSHSYSADRAASVLANRKAPKGDEYTKAEEDVDDDDVD